MLFRSVVRFDDVIGYASPRNEGVRSASAPLLAFCDADDTVATGWLDAIVAALSLHPLVGSSIEVMGSGEPSSVVVPTTFGIPVVHTCGLGCTRALFDSLGGFDPAFDAGGEDVDFSIRARLVQGVVPALAPGADYRLHLRTSLDRKSTRLNSSHT